MANTALDGKPYAGNPHVRIDEGDGAPAKPRRSSLLYTYVEWFDSLDIRDDIDEVHSLYNTVKDHSSDWGYEVKKTANGFVVSKDDIEPHRFTDKTAEQFCDYLDSLYELGVDGEYVRVTAK